MVGTVANQSVNAAANALRRVVRTECNEKLITISQVAVCFDESRPETRQDKTGGLYRDGPRHACEPSRPSRPSRGGLDRAATSQDVRGAGPGDLDAT